MRQQAMKPREQQIVEGLATGKTQKEIAWELGVSLQVIKNTVSRLRNRLGYRTTQQMIVVEYQSFLAKP